MAIMKKKSTKEKFVEDETYTGKGDNPFKIIKSNGTNSDGGVDQIFDKDTPKVFSWRSFSGKEGDEKDGEKSSGPFLRQPSFTTNLSPLRNMSPRRRRKKKKDKSGGGGDETSSAGDSTATDDESSLGGSVTPRKEAPKSARIYSKRYSSKPKSKDMSKFKFESTLTGMTRHAFVIFFALHVPLTLFIKSQVILPSNVIPTIFQDVATWYTDEFKDPLFVAPYDNVFLKAFVVFEIMFQLPFFLAALYAMITEKVAGNGWFRSSCIAYGAQGCTMVGAVLAFIACDEYTSDEEKRNLFLLYMPYFVFPLWLAIMAGRNEDVFA